MNALSLAPACMKVVGARVDALTLAYRVTLDPLFVEALHKRGRVAGLHGRASFEWRNRVPEGSASSGSRKVVRLGGLRARWAEETDERTEDGVAIWGALGFTKISGRWTITNEPYFRILVDTHAPGKTERIDEATGECISEGGWTVEIVFYAQWLAEVGLDAAVREGEAIASLMGAVGDQRLRRIDLCADIAGWEIQESDVGRLCKRPHAEWAKEYDNGDMVKASDGKRDRVRDFGRGSLDRRRITGLSVGMGGALMNRIYDKRCELAKDVNGDKRDTEEARWFANGWDGVSPVTRVEFQLRGTVLQELGIRDPHAVLETETDGRGRPIGQKIATVRGEDGKLRPLELVDRLDHIWRTCLDWVRLVQLERTRSGKLQRVCRLPDDERWALLREVQFAAARAPSGIQRFRSRGAASAAQGLGVALSQAGRDGELVEMSENEESYTPGELEAETDDPIALLRERVTRLKLQESEKIVQWLLARYADEDPKFAGVKANVHLAVRANAARMRFRERKLRELRAAAAKKTGPPTDPFPTFESRAVA